MNAFSHIYFISHSIFIHFVTPNLINIPFFYMSRNPVISNQTEVSRARSGCTTARSEQTDLAYLYCYDYQISRQIHIIFFFTFKKTKLDVIHSREWNCRQWSMPSGRNMLEKLQLSHFNKGKSKSLLIQLLTWLRNKFHKSQIASGLLHVWL